MQCLLLGVEQVLPPEQRDQPAGLEHLTHLLLEGAERERHPRRAQVLRHLADLFLARGVDAVDAAAIDQDRADLREAGPGFNDDVFELRDVGEDQRTVAADRHKPLARRLQSVAVDTRKHAIRPAPEDLRGVSQRLPVHNRARDEADKGLHIVFSYFC